MLRKSPANIPCLAEYTRKTSYPWGLRNGYGPKYNAQEFYRLGWSPVSAFNSVSTDDLDNQIGGFVMVIKSWTSSKPTSNIQLKGREVVGDMIINYSSLEFIFCKLMGLIVCGHFWEELWPRGIVARVETFDARVSCVSSTFWILLQGTGILNSTFFKKSLFSLWNWKIFKLLLFSIWILITSPPSPPRPKK